MNRRDFLTGLGSTAISLPLILDGFTTSVYANSPLLDKVAELATLQDRILVLIQLSGGNDGINTLIPLDQLPTYYAIRRAVAIPENRIVKLTDTIGLHPSFAPIKSLFDDGKLVIVQGVSYPMVNQSHFRSTDIWFTASDAEQYLSSGWLGRFVNYEAPTYPVGYPNETRPDPLAIEIGGAMSLTLQGHKHAMGITIRDLSAFEQLVSGQAASGGSVAQRTGKAGNRIDFIREVQAQSQKYSARIRSIAEQGKNLAAYPTKGNNPLADQLRIVARLISGGLQTRIYVVNLGGFDTHWSQTDIHDTTTGIHADLLRYLAEGIRVFQQDLALLKLEHRVVGMTISEFGRRPATTSNGTDHGTAGPMFLFGAPVRGGILGKNPSLTDLLPDGNLTMQYDFRQLYTSILAQWFHATPQHLDSVMLKSFQQLPILQTATVRASEHTHSSPLMTLRNYPNPCSHETTIEYFLPRASTVKLSLTDTQGREIYPIFYGHQQQGMQSLRFDVSSLASGVYFYALRTEYGFVSAQISIVR
ncbi:MAG: DUF1501 domain-containing protein [Bacteroidota bacterium]|nr:DUF1501 domain-containing protein [Candidatus Kapabacteria bacterium]MDW8219639.1 DUF1501 domain-containing protein [Bacteroidota bacterium]